MRVVIVCLAATFLVLVAPSTSAQEEEKECFTTEWAMDLIPCFVNRFIELVNLNDTDTSSLSQTEMKGPWSHHDPTTRRSRMYGPQNDMHRFFQDLKYQMAHDVGTVHPHSMTQKYRMDAVKKIQKIDFDAVYDHAVDQAVASVVTARRSAEVVLEAAVQAKVIPDYGTLDLSDSELDVICALAPSFVPGLNTPLCKVGIRVLECLHKYSDTDYEHSLKWAKCLFECEDLPFLSQCVVDQFEGCGLSWPISDLSWLGAILVRGFVDYIEMDTCVFEFEQPLNLTETIELEEGGPSTTIAFRQYLHPSVHCIDLGMLSSPIGIVGGMLQWIKGEIGVCDSKIEITTFNYMNSLLSFRIYLVNPLGPLVPVPRAVDLGLPKCRSGALLKQAVIGWHDHAVNESGIIHLDTSNWNETFRIPIAAAIDTKVDGDFVGDVTVKLRGGTILRANVKIPLIVRDKDVLSDAIAGNTMCSIVNDPHVTTFDQFYYSNHHEGHFYIYKHTEMDYSIQGVFQRCDKSAQATCLCAVSIRVGNDVFLVDQCRRVNDTDADFRKRVNYYIVSEANPGFQILRKQGGARFEAILPGGTYARILTIGKHVNLWIRPAVTDFNKTRGLCGTFNKVTADDLMLPNETVYSGEGSSQKGQPKPFNRAWRVPEDEITFMGMVKSDDVSVHESNYCSCMYVVIAGATCTCSGGHLVENCDLVDEHTDVLTPEIAKITLASPKELAKLNGFIYLDQLDIDISYDPPVFNWADNVNYTESQASSACSALETSDPTLDNCRSDYSIFQRSRVFEKDRFGCIDDVMITDTLNWSSTFKESAKERCKDYLFPRINMATHEIQEYENVTCLLDCSERGVCDQGECVCDPPYTGPACEYSGTLAPTVQPFKQLCDVRMENCSYVKVFGWNFYPEQELQCIFTPTKMEVGGMPVGGSTIHVNASYITSHQVACPLPEKSGSYEVELMNGAGTKIAVRGNAKNMKMEIISFDSICFSCTPTGECTRRTVNSTGHCLIKSRCYSNMETNPDDDCAICIPYQLSEAWSLRPTDECHEKYEEWIKEEEQSMRTRTIRIVIASVLSGTVALSAIIMFACFGSMRKEQDRLKQQYGMKAREIAKLNAAVMRSVDSGVSVGTDHNMAEISAYGYSSSHDSPSPSTSLDLKSDDLDSEKKSIPIYEEVKL